MTTIKRGTIRAYDAAEHRASVQVAGSLAVYLPAVPVATGIPAAAVVAGRDCGIVFFTDDDPADAVVVTVHGANPPAAGVSTKIEDADADTRWDAEASADEDKLRGTVAGTLRTLVQNASPHLQITGDLKVSGKILGEGVSSAGNNLIDIGGAQTYTQKVGLHIGLGTNYGVAVGQVLGIAGFSVARTSGDGLSQGLNFAAGMNGIDLANAHAIQTNGLVFGSGRTLTNFVHHYKNNVTPIFASITNYYTDYYKAQGVGTNRRYIYGEDITGGTIARFLEFANALIVKASGEYTPATNQTPVFIYEGTTPTLRQLQWKDGAAITSGDRVMVLV